MTATCDISLKTWLTDKEAQVYTGFCDKTLRQWRDDCKVTFRRFGRKIVYKRTDLDKAMEKLPTFKSIEEHKKDYRI